MDTKITDKGWAAMHKLLDREMPQKRRRRFGWWWLPLLLLPIAGYGGWLWMHSPESPAKKQEAEPEPLVASIAPILEKQAVVSALNSADISTNATAPKVRKSETEVSKTGSRNAGQEMVFAEKNVGKTDTPAQPKLSENPPSSLGAESSEASMLPSKLPLVLLHTTAQMIDVESKNALSPHFIAVADSPKPVKKHLDNRWSFGSTSAISTEQFSTINGFSTGLSVDWNFARKWGLRTGAFYNIHRPQVESRPVASVLSDTYTSSVYNDVIVVEVNTGHELVNSGGSAYGDSLGNNVFIPVNRLQRLEIPVAVFWQPARPLKIFGGVSLTRTLSTKADRQNYSGAYILKLASRTAEDGASKLSSSELDKWSADAMLGAGLRLGRMFEVGVSAKMPFSKFPGFARTSKNVINSGFTEHSVSATRNQSRPVFSLYGTLFF